MAVYLPLRALTAAVAALYLAGCGGAPSPAGLPQTPASAQSAERSGAAASPLVTKTMYVASRENAEILGFPTTANGNVAPTVTIAGSATQLDDPVGLAIDKHGRVLVVNDSDDRVLIFPAGANGNVYPQVLGGSNVQIGESEGVAVDANGLIYVSSYSTNEILVFNAGASGNAHPLRTISGPSTMLQGPVGMAFDSSGDLYVANTFASTGSNPTPAVLEFAPGAQGNATPIATLGGPGTPINDAFNVSVDPSNRIIIAPESGTQVEVFAAGSNGNVPPVATISGSKTGLTEVSSTGVDKRGRIYVTNVYAPGSELFSSIFVFKSSANGNAKPVADITGSATQIDNALNPTIH